MSDRIDLRVLARRRHAHRQELNSLRQRRAILRGRLACLKRQRSGTPR